MWNWAKPYMQELAKIATRNGGVILEIGFGLGLSADYIQKQAIEKHVIVEMNTDVFAKLKVFMQSAPKTVEPILGLWQEVIPSMPDESFDGIIFDAYPLSADDLEYHFSFFENAYRLLKRGGVFTYYSSEETDFSSQHLQKLHAAGFKNIQKKVCAVNPSEDCLYWKSKTIVAPIVIK
jgi:guanidinoacetate N-methyltransferase